MRSRPAHISLYLAVALTLLIPLCAAAQDRGPIWHWPLRDGAGETVRAAIGDAPPAKIVGAQWRDGGLWFDGKASRVELGAIDIGGTALTLAAWVRADSFVGQNADGRVLSKATGVQEQDHYWMLSGYRTGTNQPQLRFRLKTGGTTATLMGGRLVTGRWMHLAATYDGSAMRLFINGEEVARMAKSGAIDRNDQVSVWVGDNPPQAGSRPWHGIIEDLRIYDRALPGEELKALVAASGKHIAAVEPQPPQPAPTTAGDRRVRWRHLSTVAGDLPASGQGNQQTASVVADFDKDGVAEFVIAERTQAPSVVWYRRTKTGWDRYVIDDTKLRIEAGGTVADLDGDGDLDLVHGGDSGSNQVWWWENPHPNFEPNTPWKRHLIKDWGGNQYHDQMLGDFDGDGKPELAFWNQRAQKLYLGDVPTDPRVKDNWKFQEIFSWPQAFKYEGLAKCDIDGDGVEDLVGGGMWFKHQGGAYKPLVIDQGYGSSRSAAGNLIRGGWAEVVLNSGDEVGPLNLYEYVHGVWTKRTLIDHVDHGHTLAVGDVDRDGNLDIYAAEMHTPGSGAACRQWLLYGDGKGGFQIETISVGIGNHESRLADLDGDGDLDILGKPYTWSAPRLDIWLNEG